MKALLVLLLASPALAQTSVRVSEVPLGPSASGAAGTIGGAALPLPVLGAGSFSRLSPSLSQTHAPALTLTAPAALAAQAVAAALPIPVLPEAAIPEAARPSRPALVLAAAPAAETFRRQATAMRALAVAAPVKTGDAARLDGLFEGSTSRGEPDASVLASAPVPLAPLIKALPAFSPAKFEQPVKLYGKFQLRRKAREAAYWGSMISVLASGGVALQTVSGLIVNKLLAKDSSRLGEMIHALPPGAKALPAGAPETVVIREAIEELDRRVSGETRPFHLLVVDHAESGNLEAYAGAGADKRPFYRISAEYGRARDQATAEINAAVLAHEHAHAYKNDSAHLYGAALGGWKGMIPSLLTAGGILAAKAAILASPLMALPYAGPVSIFLIGPGLAWTAALLGVFLALNAAFALLDAAVYRVIEYEADYFAAGHTNPDWVIRMLRRFEESVPVDLHDRGAFALHPSLSKRIARLRAVFENGRKP